MPQSPKLLPTISVTTFNDLASTFGQLGQEAIAEDTMVKYVFDGTNWVDTPLRKLSSKGNAPTVTMSSGAGTGATGTAMGTNVAGTITITTGVSLIMDGTLFTITLADGVTFPNKTIVQLQGLDPTTLGILSSIFQSVSAASGATIKMKGLGLSVSTTYTFSYQIMGY